tara:strand:+ start:957 stop:1418 length:462 start_codon:yes stop_codon:yes gene_type:complete
MPNLVHNTLSIQFDDEKEFNNFIKKIKKVKNTGTETFYSLAYSLFPPSIEDKKDEYMWTIENYGGKWGDWYTETKHMHRSNKAVYVFDSAWAPLLTLAERINELLEREVSLNFWSLDNMNEGVITWSRDLEIIEDEYRDINYEDLEMVPYEEE